MKTIPNHYQIPRLNTNEDVERFYNESILKIKSSILKIEGSEPMTIERTLKNNSNKNNINKNNINKDNINKDNIKKAKQTITVDDQITTFRLWGLRKTPLLPEVNEFFFGHLRFLWPLFQLA